MRQKQRQTLQTIQFPFVAFFEVKRNNTVVEQKDRELLISFKNNYGTLQLLSIKEVQKRVTKAEPANQEESEVKTEDVEISKTASEFKGGN